MKLRRAIFLSNGQSTLPTRQLKVQSGPSVLETRLTRFIIPSASQLRTPIRTIFVVAGDMKDAAILGSLLVNFLNELKRVYRRLEMLGYTLYVCSSLVRIYTVLLPKNNAVKATQLITHYPGIIIYLVQSLIKNCAFK